MAKRTEHEIPMPFTSAEFLSAWQEWMEYRRQKRLPKYVPAGLQKTFTKLKNDSGNNEQVAIEMLHYSMSQNYQGIFKEKTNGLTKSITTAATQQSAIAKLFEIGQQEFNAAREANN